MQETQEMGIHSLGWEDTLVEKMATYSRILAWKIPWTGELRGFQSIGPPGSNQYGRKELDMTEHTPISKMKLLHLGFICFLSNCKKQWRKRN